MPRADNEAIIQPMSSVADAWWNEDRRDLFHSVEVIASDSPEPQRVGQCLDTILNDLELYDDPRQGAGMWLYDNELHIAEQLGFLLHSVAAGIAANEAEARAIGGGAWLDARGVAVHLRDLMALNGDFTR